MINPKVKPFLKWAGGKTQLIHEIESYLPSNFRKEKNITYIEPFVGGGALLFYMLQNYPNIKRAVINDINKHLINTYKVVRNQPNRLIGLLSDLQSAYKNLDNEELQRDFFLDIRRKFNSDGLSDVEDAAYMIFLNRTCFNGLYRENSKGEFNVPFGKYSNPTICDEELLLADSAILQRVEILNGDFSQTQNYIDGFTFFYFDPPYRPLDATSSFNSYVREPFDDNEQKRLNLFYSFLSENGCYEMLSNSDCKARNENDDFFDELYKDFYIERVNAKRNINSNPNKRGILSELLIRNYRHFQGENALI